MYIINNKKRKVSTAIAADYTDFSFIKNGMEFVSDSETDEYFDDEEILFQTSQILCESEED